MMTAGAVSAGFAAQRTPAGDLADGVLGVPPGEVQQFRRLAGHVRCGAVVAHDPETHRALAVHFRQTHVVRVIHERADAAKPLMGLITTRPGKIIRREDVSIAKNYLNETELQTLNRIVNLYIEFAELQALNRKSMTMRNWIEKLDEFLKISGRDLLDHAGRITAETAKLKAETEYDRYRALADAQPRPVDTDFEQAAKQLQKISRTKKLRPPKP